MKKLLLLIPVLVGCGASHELMPMQVGKRWNYSATSGFNTFTTNVKVVRETGVAGTTGYVLSGPMGESRLAWKDGKLLAERMGNTRFDPPLILAVEASERVKVPLNGDCMGIWGKMAFKGELNQSPSEVQVGGQKIQVVKSDIVLTGPGRNIRLRTNFQPGVGIATQSQQINSTQVLSMERTSGS